MASDSSSLPFTLKSGEAAEVLSSDGEKVTIRSPLPSPPGSTVRGNAPEVNSEFQLKVRSCRKMDDAFVIEGRTQNATRALKAWLRSE